MKRCVTCRQEKDLNSFKKARGKGYGLRCEECRVRVNQTTRNWFEKNGVRQTPDEHRCSTYKITVEQFQSMKAAQNGRCAICQQEESLVIDHCHQTGKVRGLLCNACNFALGFFRDSPDKLLAAIKYLSR